MIPPTWTLKPAGHQLAFWALLVKREERDTVAQILDVNINRRRRRRSRPQRQRHSICPWRAFVERVFYSALYIFTCPRASLESGTCWLPVRIVARSRRRGKIEEVVPCRWLAAGVAGSRALSTYECSALLDTGSPASFIQDKVWRGILACDVASEDGLTMVPYISWGALHGSTKSHLQPCAVEYSPRKERKSWALENPPSTVRICSARPSCPPYRDVDSNIARSW